MGRSPGTVAETVAALRHRPGAVAWIGPYRPDAPLLGSLAQEFGLHPLAVEDAVCAHQRPEIERHDDLLLVVLRAARHVDAAEEVDVGELHLVIGPDVVITVRHSGSPDLGLVRARVELDPALLARGPEAVLSAILDAVVDGYAPVVASLENDIEEIETEVFRGDPTVSRRIDELSREVVEFERATHPLLGVLGALTAGFVKDGVDEELQRSLRDVADHLTAVDERIDGFRVAPRDILTVDATLVAQAQNEEVRRLGERSDAQDEEVEKISAWAAVLFAPTLVGTVHGTDSEHGPELDRQDGYSSALGLVVVGGCVLHAAFRRRRWI